MVLESTHMRRSIVISLTILALLFLCYRLLFVFLDISTFYMESDSDVNTVGKGFLFLSPLIIFGGIWGTYRALRILDGTLKYSYSVILLLSLYGGLFGIVFIDLLLHASFNIENYVFVNTLYTISFIVLAWITFYGLRNYLIKNSVSKSSVGE